MATLAAELYLVENWDSYTGTVTERRNAIFHDFVKAGMRERWQWHAKAEGHRHGDFAPEERQILKSIRDRQTAYVGWNIAQQFSQVVVSASAHLDQEGSLYYVLDDDENEDDERMVCKYNGDPFDVLPELAWCMTTFDDPDDVEEARKCSRDQTLWVSGVFWLDNKLVWIDEFGATIREKVCSDPAELRETMEALSNYNFFEGSWWIEATKMGRYAGDDWWQ